MAQFTTIKKADAPLPIRGGRLRRMALYEDHVRNVLPGEVGRLIPDKGETARGLALRVGRAARRIQRPMRAWINDGVLYFEPVS